MPAEAGTRKGKPSLRFLFKVYQLSGKALRRIKIANKILRNRGALMIRTLIDVVKKLYAPKSESRIASRSIRDQIHYPSREPKWMSDPFNTGFCHPEKPIWLDKWEREVCLRREQVDEVYLSPQRYDQLAQYLEDLDKHHGKIREHSHLPRIIVCFTWWGSVRVLRREFSEPGE